MIALVIWTDPKTRDEVNKYRSQFDTHHTLIDPHITVLFPIEPAESLDEISQFVSDQLRAVTPFELRIKQWKGFMELAEGAPGATNILVSHFPACVNMIGLIVDQGKDEIIDIRNLLGRDKWFTQAEDLISYAPYMAIAHELSLRDYRQTLDLLSSYHPDYQFEVTGLDLIKQDESGKWSIERTFQLDV